MLIEILRLVIVKLGMISLLLSPNCRSIKLENRTTSVNIQNNEYYWDSKCDSQEFIIADTDVLLHNLQYFPGQEREKQAEGGKEHSRTFDDQSISS